MSFKENYANKKDKSTISEIARFLSDLNVKQVFKVHACFCIFFGGFLFVMPRSVFSVFSKEYDHMAHEYMRLYGIINITVGWLIYRMGPLADKGINIAVSEAFSICYLAQSMVMLRAQFTNPSGHSIFHWLIILLFAFLGSLYVYVRFLKKKFILPGSHET